MPGICDIQLDLGIKFDSILGNPGSATVLVSMRESGFLFAKYFIRQIFNFIGSKVRESVKDKGQLVQM